VTKNIIHLSCTFISRSKKLLLCTRFVPQDSHLQKGKWKNNSNNLQKLAARFKELK